MTDKAIGDLTEITSLGANDFLVVETSGGNSRKIKKSNAALGGRAIPAIVQKATLRGDGTIALATAPTVGNTMVLVMAGFSVTSLPGTYKPAGFGVVGSYNSDSNNAVVVAVRKVQSGDTGSYAMSTSDNQAAVLYEISDYAGIYGLAGGAMSSFFSSANYTLSTPPSPFGPNDIVLGAMTQDTTATWSITGETGLVVDFLTPSDGQNHTGAFFHYDGTIDGAIAGSTSASPTQPAYGLFAIVGKPN